VWRFSNKPIVLGQNRILPENRAELPHLEDDRDKLLEDFVFSHLSILMRLAAFW
jgi:hypothetical protein